jgi:hypothetical protein
MLLGGSERASQRGKQRSDLIRICSCLCKPGRRLPLLERDVEGEAILQDGIKIAPRSAILHHALGLNLVRMKWQDAALVEFEQATTLDLRECALFLCYAMAL